MFRKFIDKWKIDIDCKYFWDARKRLGFKLMYSGREKENTISFNFPYLVDCNITFIKDRNLKEGIEAISYGYLMDTKGIDIDLGREYLPGGDTRDKGFSTTWERILKGEKRGPWEKTIDSIDLVAREGTVEGNYVKVNYSIRSVEVEYAYSRWYSRYEHKYVISTDCILTLIDPRTGNVYTAGGVDAYTFPQDTDMTMVEMVDKYRDQIHGNVLKLIRLH